MSASRLSHALSTGVLSTGVLTLPPGPVVVFGPPPGYDLSALIAERDRAAVTIVSQDAVASAHWQAAGFAVTRTAEGPFAAALVVLPRARAAQKARIAEAAGLAPLVLVDGQKHDGIDAIVKALKARTTLAGQIAKAHGKLVWLTQASFPDWAAVPRDLGGFVTRPGVFSADGPDPGSQALAAALPPLAGTVADLGAGWGYLGRAILASDKVSALHLVEADGVALDCARENLADPRARFHWADATVWRPPGLLDAVVTNPPFHTTRASDPDLGRAFIAAARRMLAPQGSLWLVANRHLPYEAALAGAFATVQTLAEPPGFKIIHATRPKPGR